MRYIGVISGVVAALAFTATASAGSIEDKAHVTVGGAESSDVTVVIDISEKAFHITKGGQSGYYSHGRDAHGHSTSQPGSRGA